MVQFQDTDKFQNPTPSYNGSGSTLLKKFDIPLNHLDFDYVNACRNAEELEKILQILQSGEEGYYPQLIERTEQKLTELKPNSKYLRKTEKVLNKNDLNKENLNEISEDLTRWLVDINKKNEELIGVKNKSKTDLPDIRQSKQIKIENEKKQINRIKSTDYSAWDKYDVETELLKMDLEDKKLKNEAEKLKDDIKKPQKVKFNPFLTRAEAIFEAQRENEKGNEYFKAKENENSIEHYNNSILYHKNPTTFKNRASAYMNLKKYQEAINDYKEALRFNECDFEALFRMAQCYQQLKMYHDANVYIENAIFINPNDVKAQKLAESIRKSINDEPTEGKITTRLKISNIGGEKINKKDIKPILKKEEKVIVPIPGSSKMPGPYFKVVNRSELPGELKKDKIKKKSICFNLDEDNLNKTELKMIEGNENENKRNVKEVVNKKSVAEIIARKPIDVNRMNQIVKAKIIELEQKGEENKIEEIKMDEINVEDVEMEEINLGSNKINEISIREMNRNVKLDKDLQAGGEPCQDNNQEVIFEQIHMPYSFIQAWLGARKENNYLGFVKILQNLDPQRLTEVIGNKLDATMLNEILNCLYRHFTVAHEVERVYNLLTNLPSISRFNIVTMFLPHEDKTLLHNLINFLKQHGRNIPNNILRRYNLL